MNKSKTSIFLILSASLVIFSLGSLSAYPLAARAACSQKDFTLTISPTSTSLTATLIVDDLTLTANPTKAKVSAGQTAFSTITVTGENGFSGTINYSVNEPSFVCNLQPDPVALSSTTTSISSTLSCNFSSGTNTVSISAAPNSGSPVRSLTVTITVH